MSRPKNPVNARRLNRLIIGASIVAGLAAATPIVGAMLGFSDQQGTPRTAFASAPAGNYAVVLRDEGTQDVLAIAGAGDDTAIRELARIPHLDGHTSTGAVSPDGTSLALVVVDSGSRSDPAASLAIGSLEDGRFVRMAVDLEPRQTPLWSPAGDAVVVTRSGGGPDAQGPVEVVRVEAAGGEELLWAATGALGVYPVGWDGDRLLSVVIDARGSTLQRDGEDFAWLSSGFTRDWRLSPDGSALAFIETAPGEGAAYVARTVSLGNVAGVRAEGLAAPVSALGVAWAPGSGIPTFGVEPMQGLGAGAGLQATAGVSAQALTAETAGFDIPLAYTADGDALAVQHWSGPDFDAPGKPTLQLVDGSGSTPIESFTRFLGWARR